MPDDHSLKASIGQVSQQAKPIVTVFGDGQLARMLQPAAAELDIHLRILASSGEQSAAQVIPDVSWGIITTMTLSPARPRTRTA